MSNDNIYLTTPIVPLLAKTATPIVVIMLVNGLFAVVDAYFLGQFVGTAAVISVSLMFPLTMLLFAFSTLVAGGFSSIYARQIGAADTMAPATFANAVQLSLLICAILCIGFACCGTPLIAWITKGDAVLIGLGHTYLSIMVYATPLAFILALYGDALRAEGHLTVMAAIALGSALLNILFDYLLIVPFQMGVAGSAVGTVMSQICAFASVLIWRKRSRRSVPLQWEFVPHQWGRMLALGAPMSLGYIGISLSAGVTVMSLQTWASADFATLSGAYGIMTRLTTLTYLPLLGLGMALQTIVGNNVGAQQPKRVSSTRRCAITISLFYGVMIQGVLFFAAPHLGAIFVDDTAIHIALAQIMPVNTAAFFLIGPMMMISRYFQAIGDASRAAILGVLQTYVFTLPLMVILPYFFGTMGIWMASPISAGLMCVVTILVLMQFRSNRAKTEI